MEVVFYDRKNKREVKASQLMDINYVEVTLVIDSEEFKDGPWQGPDKHPAYLKEKQIGSIGYRSEVCHTRSNWDLSLHDTDLIFLRLEN